MRLKNLYNVVFHFLMAISTALVGTFLASWILIFGSLKIEHLEQLVNLSIKSVMSNYNQLMSFLLLPWVKNLNMTDFPSSPSGLSHFYEVKVLFQLVLVIFIFGLFFAILAKRNQYSLSISRNQTFLLMLIPIMILPMAMMNFDAFFVFFHGIFFHNADWLFDPATDPIINVLSENFFASCFVAFGILYESYLGFQLIPKRKKTTS